MRPRQLPYMHSALLCPLTTNHDPLTMRILVAEDDTSIAAGVCASLRQSGHAVDHVADGARAEAALRDHPYDLLILDLGLPELDGSEVLQRMRRRGASVPVLVVTAREGLRERVRVLDLGADDYLVKPFALVELEARVRALLRRRTTQGTPELHIGKLRLDLPGHRAWIDETPLELTAREFGLIEALAVRPDRVTSRAQLVEALCDWDEELTDNGLDIALHRLRRKLLGSGTSVRTIRGLGYLLEESEVSSDGIEV
jgi:two-component system OmpR family response regulator